MRIYRDIDQYGGVCKLTITSDIITTSTTMTSANASTTTKPAVWCEDSWELRPDSSDCYKATGRQLDWKETEEVCQMFGGNLASIHDSIKNDFVLKFAWAFTNQPIWIGYSNVYNDINYTWIDGSSVTYENWDHDNKEPRDPLCTDSCVKMNPLGKWISVDW